MSKLTSEGICNFCGGTFDKSVMTRHLKTCRADKTAPQTEGVKQKSFWLMAEGTDFPEYWLHIEVPASSRLSDVDQFLRDIWLECCGHLSAFTIGGVRYELDTGMVDAMWKDFFGPSAPPQNMTKTRLHSVLKSGMKFHHEYDFGTTTELTLKVVAEGEIPGRSRDVFILARNNPPDIPCHKCKKPATLVCSQCVYDGPQAWLCREHARRHKCGEDMFLPVVNSPRVGMCGYTGNAEFEEDDEL